MEREHLNFYLQQASPNALRELCRLVEDSASVTVLQPPTAQTLLLPVADPVTDGCFYGGEVLATSAIVEVKGSKGWAMVIDENPEMARDIAILDAAYAAGIHRREIVTLARHGKRLHEDATAKLASQVETTRVNFDLM